MSLTVDRVSQRRASTACWTRCVCRRSGESASHLLGSESRYKSPKSRVISPATWPTKDFQRMAGGVGQRGDQYTGEHLCPAYCPAGSWPCASIYPPPITETDMQFASSTLCVCLAALPICMTRPKTEELSTVLQFQRRFLNWYWHSWMPILAPSPM